MTTYIVKRVWNRYGDSDYLTSWDVIWGPVWSGAKSRALTFATEAKAADAAKCATAIMAPRPWCVPDYSKHDVSVAESAA